MKRSWFVGMVLLFLLNGSPARAQDPITEIIRRGVIKVIKAVDLKIQRMQNETLWVQNAQKALENTLSKTRLEEIAGWVSKQRNLYQDYYEQLWRVKAAVSFYAQVRELAQRQMQIVRAYKTAWSGVRQDKHFTTQELVYIGNTYTGILKQSLHNIEQVHKLVQSFALEMTDGQRMELVGKVAEDINKNYADLKAFNARNIQVSIGRAKDEQDIAVVRKIYGL